MIDDEMDLLSLDALIDPYPVYGELRRNAPVHWDARLRGWVVTRYADVYAANSDAELYSSGRRMKGVMNSRVPADLMPKVETLTRLVSQWALMSDPPAHARLRRHLQRAFNPRTVAALEPHITGIVHELLRPVRENGRADAMADFAYPTPAYVMADLFGFPREDATLIKGWWDALKIFFGGSPDLLGTLDSAMAGWTEMMRYFGAAIEEKRRAPDGGFISHLVAVDRDGGFLTDEELRSNLIGVLGASYSTTMDMIGNGLYALLRHRDQWDLLVERPELSARVVDELVRYDGPVQVTQRVVTGEVTLGGQDLHDGDLVFLVRGSANRDPARFAEPDRLDLTRDTSGHLGFGTGPHYCVGGVLGRMVGRISFEALARDFPDLRLDPAAQPCWRADTLQFRGLNTLPVVVGTGT